MGTGWESNALNSYVKNVGRNSVASVGFDVVTAVGMKVAIFGDIAPCSPYVKGRFGGDTTLRTVGSYLDYTALFPKGS
jgi:hypothetical protein